MEQLCQRKCVCVIKNNTHQIHFHLRTHKHYCMYTSKHCVLSTTQCNDKYVWQQWLDSVCIMSELHCESSEWQLCTYKTLYLDTWNSTEGLSTFQFQTCDLTSSPREGYNYYISCYHGNIIVEEKYEWHSDVLPRYRLHYISICRGLHLLLPSQVGGWSETIIMGLLSLILWSARASEPEEHPRNTLVMI